MDKVTRKDNRRREFRRQTAQARVRSVMGSFGPGLTPIMYSGSPVFFPKRSDIIKRKRRAKQRS